MILGDDNMIHYTCRQTLSFLFQPKRWLIPSRNDTIRFWFHLLQKKKEAKGRLDHIYRQTSSHFSSSKLSKSKASHNLKDVGFKRNSKTLKGEIIIISIIPPEEIQLIPSNPNSLCRSLKASGQCWKRWWINSPFFIAYWAIDISYKSPNLRWSFGFLNETNKNKSI